MALIEDEVVPVAGCNSEMSHAIDAARESFGQFLAAFQAPKPNQTDFHVKARFKEDGSAEHIWLSEISFEHKIATGVVMNEPRIKSVRYL